MSTLPFINNNMREKYNRYNDTPARNIYLSKYTNEIQSDSNRQCIIAQWHKRM